MKCRSQDMLDPSDLAHFLSEKGIQASRKSWRRENTADEYGSVEIEDTRNFYIGMIKKHNNCIVIADWISPVSGDRTARLLSRHSDGFLSFGEFPTSLRNAREA